MAPIKMSNFGHLYLIYMYKDIKVIGFDADDTLWSNAVFFQEAEEQFKNLLASFMTAEELSKELYETEMRNMTWFGYGAMAFTLSMIETAVRVSSGKVSAQVLAEILQAGKSILAKPIELFPGVPDIFPPLGQRYRLVVVTKGDLLDQERKLEKSGLLPYFQHVEVVSEKHEANYRQLIQFMGIQPNEFLMVGNSLKSDVLPVLAVGGNAIHVPYASMWQHEWAEKPNRAYFELSSLLELPALLAY